MKNVHFPSGADPAARPSVVRKAPQQLFVDPLATLLRAILKLVHRNKSTVFDHRTPTAVRLQDPQN
jgi:hypothetical protein